jgi:hypothetical protein
VHWIKYYKNGKPHRESTGTDDYEAMKGKYQRKGRNPQTGKWMTLPSRKAMTFKCSGVLRAAMNERATEEYRSSPGISKMRKRKSQEKDGSP